jgi:hypothetical protein
VLLNVPVMTTIEYMADARQALVMYASVISIALLASAALSMGVALVALTWRGIAERLPATRDPWSYDRYDPANPGARARGHQRNHGGPAVTIAVPLSGETFEAELVADESGVQMLYEPSRAKHRAFYPLARSCSTSGGASWLRHPRSRPSWMRTGSGAGGCSNELDGTRHMGKHRDRRRSIRPLLQLPANREPVRFSCDCLVQKR